MSEDKFLKRVFPVSKLPHSSKYCGKIPHLVCRSSWEVSFVKYLDRNPNILQWRSEEDVVIYKSIDGRLHRYFIDFFCRIQVGDKVRECLIEIKPWREAQNKPILTEGMSEKTKRETIERWAINKAKWEAARKYAQKMGWKFLVITEKDVCFNGKNQKES